MIFDQLARCRPFLEPALKWCDGTHNWDDICAGIYTGAFQFWPLERSAIVTEILAHPRKRTFNVFIAGGDLKEIKGHVPTLQAFAAEHGCTLMQCAGRPGWARVLDGWHSEAPILRRALTVKEIES